MSKVVLCRDCQYFKPDGNYKMLYPGEEYLIPGELRTKMGECQHPIKPPYGRHKNENNTCDNCQLKN